MSRFVVQAKSSRYLELRPYDHVWTWLAPDSSFATKFFTLAMARATVLSLPLEMQQDVGCIVELGQGIQHEAFEPETARQSA